ncbi:MAG: YbgF trimerization domain-containing protein [Allosphingosinicella sp.]|uniref:tetratricopeptide repeat protein n=1 Tax=Allosphingosinicella sp. TaxID=2823234 RepID=UPI0039626556
MRFHLLALVLLAGTAAPAVAQSPAVERRIDRLEQEMRAVQRRVFPGGAGAVVEPEIRPEQQQPLQPGGATGNALSALNARVDALEAQLRTLTGQTEENSHRIRQLEEALSRFQRDTESRLSAAERAAAAPVAQAPVAAPPAAGGQSPAPRPATNTSATNTPAANAPAAGTAATPAADPAQEAYNAGYRLWEQRRFQEAQQALEAAAAAHPNSRWASWSRNLAGRAYLDDNKPATAARILLANYQDNPRGERAADSLFFLGQALVQLGRRPEACRVYDELQEVYPNMRDWLRQRLPEARRNARCTN